MENTDTNTNTNTNTASTTPVDPIDAGRAALKEITAKEASATNTDSIPKASKETETPVVEQPVVEQPKSVDTSYARKLKVLAENERKLRAERDAIKAEREAAERALQDPSYQEFLAARKSGSIVAAMKAAGYTPDDFIAEATSGKVKAPDKVQELEQKLAALEEARQQEIAERELQTSQEQMESRRLTAIKDIHEGLQQRASEYPMLAALGEDGAEQVFSLAENHFRENQRVLKLEQVAQYIENKLKHYFELGQKAYGTVSEKKPEPHKKSEPPPTVSKALHEPDYSNKTFEQIKEELRNSWLKEQ